VKYPKERAQGNRYTTDEVVTVTEEHFPFAALPYSKKFEIEDTDLIMGLLII
jgi:hypothetical protein